MLSLDIDFLYSVYIVLFYYYYVLLEPYVISNFSFLRSIPTIPHTVIDHHSKSLPKIIKKSIHEEHYP